jgi:hypothetical protein
MLEVKEDNRGKFGSANGNRTCIAPVQFIPVRSKSLSLRSVCKARMAQMSPRTVDVAARWQRAHTIPHPLTVSDAAVENAPDADVAEVTTREVPEDDVPEEYLNQD